MKTWKRITGIGFQVFVIAALIACTSSGNANTDEQQIQVKQVSEESLVTSEIKQTKTFDQCNSTSSFKTQIQFGDSISQSSQQELVLGANLTGSGDLPIGVKLELEGFIQQHYSSTNTTNQSHLENASIEVPAHTKQEYIIVWNETRSTGTVEYTENGQDKSIDFSYRVGLSLASTQGRDLPCDTTVLPTSTPEPPQVVVYKSAVQDLKVRQAIAYCIDKYAITQAVFPSLSSSEIEGLVMDSFLQKSHWAYTTPPIQYSYDPNEGQHLLDQAGWTWNTGNSFRSNSRGEELSLTLTTTGLNIRQVWSTVFKQQMQTCGIHIILLSVDPNWLFSPGTGAPVGDFQLGGWYWDASENPTISDNFSCANIPTSGNNWNGGNWNRWCNTSASDASIKAVDLSLSQAERKQYFATVQEEFAKDLPAIPLFFRTDTSGWEHIEFNLDP